MVDISEKFPILDFSGGRKREYNLYSEDQRASVVYHYLVEGLAFRPLDRIILGLNPESSKGWQSMGICHYLGLVNKHKGFFKGWTPGRILASLAELSKNTDYCMIYYHLVNYFEKYVSMTDVDKASILLMEKTNPQESVKSQTWICNTWLSKTKNQLIDERLLSFPSSIPGDGINIKVSKDVICYVSKPVLKESVKSLYDYRCQACGQVVLRTGWSENLDRRSKWKYMSADVHHVLPLSKHGPDSRENMLCLCPTCHRRFHTGQFRLKTNNDKVILVDELLGQKTELRNKHKIILY